MSWPRTPLEAARSLVAEANAFGGRDNITVGIIEVVVAPRPPEFGDTTTPRSWR